MKVDVKLKDPRYCTGCPFIDVTDEGSKYCLMYYFTPEKRKTATEDGLEKTIRPDICKEIHEL